MFDGPWPYKIEVFHILLQSRSDLLQVVYSGPTEVAAHYFSELGYVPPAEVNIADYLLDLVIKSPADQVRKTRTSCKGQSANRHVGVDNLEVCLESVV